MLRRKEALELASRMTNEVFTRAWYDGRIPADLILNLADSCATQVNALRGWMEEWPGHLVVAVTHDWNLMAVREHLFGARFEDVGWIPFLDGLAFARDEGGLRVAWNDRVGRIG